VSGDNPTPTETALVMLHFTPTHVDGFVSADVWYLVANMLFFLIFSYVGQILLHIYWRYRCTGIQVVVVQTFIECSCFLLLNMFGCFSVMAHQRMATDVADMVLD